MTELPQGTVTFLFTDIEASTELSRRLGPAFGDVRAVHRRLVREAVAAHRGHEIDAQGDALFAAFDRASDAVAAAVAAQRALADAEWPEHGRVAVRIGIHTAEPYLHDEGYFGVGVSRAARICAAAHGGQILLSNATAGVVEDLDLPGVRLRELESYRLKDIPQPQRLVQVDVEGLQTEFGRLRARGVAGAVATIVMTDLSGWLGVMRTLGDDVAAVAATAYHRLASEIVEANDGRTVEMVADNVVALFANAKDAVLAAVAVRDAIRDRDWIALDERPALCVAVHTGRIADPDRRQLGTPALRCARLCASAEGWQVLVSHATHSVLEGVPLEPVALRYLGDRQLEGDERPVPVFEAVPATARSGASTGCRASS
jgi:class 3 adenylate cyclase